MLAERGRRPCQGVSALNSQLCWKPCSSQNPGFGPFRRCEIVLGAQVLGKRRQQRVPPLAAGGCGLSLDQAHLDLGGLPPILLKELPDQLLTDLVIHRRGEILGEDGQTHGPVAAHHVAPNPARAPHRSGHMYAADLDQDLAITMPETSGTSITPPAILT